MAGMKIGDIMESGLTKQLRELRNGRLYYTL